MVTPTFSSREKVFVPTEMRLVNVEKEVFIIFERRLNMSAKISFVMVVRERERLAQPSNSCFSLRSTEFESHFHVSSEPSK